MSAQSGFPSLRHEPTGGHKVFPVEFEDGSVWLLDQLRLPNDVVFHRLSTADEVVDAIRKMVVRGAPAIGIAAAYAMVLVAQRERGDSQLFALAMGIAAKGLNRARPTAVNLMWATTRMLSVAMRHAGDSADERSERLLREARAIHREDAAACQKMSELGVEALAGGGAILTHCNTGALATGGIGTALGVIRLAHAQGKCTKVFANETRPYLQGARLTAWELAQDNIEVTLLTDGMSGHFFQHGEIQSVVVGSDRIAANADIANKIGTYTQAVLAHAHQVPFYVAAPWSTVDLSVASGASIEVEQRSSDEAALIQGVRIAPHDVSYAHPAFDITPAGLVRQIFTERGVIDVLAGQVPASMPVRGA